MNFASPSVSLPAHGRNYHFLRTTLSTTPRPLLKNAENSIGPITRIRFEVMSAGTARLRVNEHPQQVVDGKSVNSALPWETSMPFSQFSARALDGTITVEIEYWSSLQ